MSEDMKKLKGSLKDGEVHLHDLFNVAWEMNKKPETRTELSQKVTTYLPGLMQDLGYMTERNITVEDDKCEIAGKLNIELLTTENIPSNLEIIRFQIPIDSETDTWCSGDLAIEKKENGYTFYTNCLTQDVEANMLDIMNLGMNEIYKNLTEFGL